MPENPHVLPCLRGVQHLIKERGWSPTFSVDDDGPLNLRQAVAKSTTSLVGGGATRIWYATYTATTKTLGAYLKAGINSWEFDVKTPSEVEAMLAEVINRMEADAPVN